MIPLTKGHRARSTFSDERVQINVAPEVRDRLHALLLGEHFMGTGVGYSSFIDRACAAAEAEITAGQAKPKAKKPRAKRVSTAGTWEDEIFTAHDGRVWTIQTERIRDMGTWHIAWKKNPPGSNYYWGVEEAIEGHSDKRVVKRRIEKLARETS